MPNSNAQADQTAAGSGPSPLPAQPLASTPSSVEGHRALFATPAQPTTQPPSTHVNPAQFNTPLAGSLNAKPPLFYIKASAAQLKTIIQSAPEEVRSRIRANASKEAMLDEIFRLRQHEAINATHQPQDPISPQEALRKLLTMDSGDVPVPADTNPDSLRSLMEAALLADSTLMPRVVPEDRHAIICTVLTWQVNAHRKANPPRPQGADNQPARPVQLPDQNPPHPPASGNQGETDTQEAPHATRQTTDPTGQPGTSIAELIAPATGQRRPPHPTGAPDIEESDEEPDGRRKRAREANLMESWIEGFHTGADAALEQTLSSYPENRPGANRLNVTTFRGPKILGKIISRNMGLQQHVASFPFWKRSASGRPTQSQMEAHNLARMMQLELLAHNSPLEALRHRPSLEVGLRRLYAIMYVEKQIATKRDARTRVSLAEHRIPTRVDPVGHIDVRRYRGRDDSPSNAVKAPHRSHQGHKRIGHSPSEARDEQQSPNRQPGSQQTPQPRRRERRPQRVDERSNVPACNSNTFPIPPLKTTDKITKAANTAIDSLNMLYAGPAHASTYCSNPRANATALRAADSVKHTISRMMQSRDEHAPTDPTAVLAETPSYVLLPTLREIFDNPESAFRKGQFQRIKPESLDLPPRKGHPQTERSRIMDVAFTGSSRRHLQAASRHVLR